MLWGLCATSKHIYCHGLFCPPLLLALSKWLHAPGYLKTSNASKALTISRDCCYVISGKKVILLHPPPHPPTHRVFHLTHTNTQSLACVPQTHRFTEQYTDREKLLSLYCYFAANWAGEWTWRQDTSTHINMHIYIKSTYCRRCDRMEAIKGGKDRQAEIKGAR